MTRRGDEACNLIPGTLESLHLGIASRPWMKGRHLCRSCPGLRLIPDRGGWGFAEIGYCVT